MGFLLDLIHRLLGGKTKEPEPAQPSPTTWDQASEITTPKPARARPGPTPPEAEESATEGAMSPVTAGGPPKPLGLPSDLAAPLLGDRGVEDGPPTSREWLDDLQTSPMFTARSPEAANLRRRSDRALVASGYLTVEQLGAIQRELASKVEPKSAPDPATVAERRSRRKAEIARNRQERAEASAKARGSTIVYLGRGVSEALGDHRGDPTRLELAGLPRLDFPSDLAERLGISVPRLRWLAFHAEVATRVHYVSFDVAKKSGGTRRLSAPHRSLALAQRWILEEIVARLPTEPEAHGFVPGRSIVTNATPHSGRAVVVNMDLEGFFPGIGYRRVRSVFERLGYSPAMATILGLLCTEAPRRSITLDGANFHVATGPRGLPQGACTSPGLSNQVARRLDRRLGGLASKLGATHTRYADDLTFSGGIDLNSKVGYLMKQVRMIASSEGFRVNESKSRVLRRNAAQIVTGLVVNDRPGVARDEVRRLRAILHRAKLEGLDAQNRDARPDFRSWLQGKIAFITMVRPEAGARLLADFQAIEV